MNKEKIQSQVLKDVRKVWSDKTQIGFSELAMQKAISRTIELMEEDKSEYLRGFNAREKSADKIIKEIRKQDKADFKKMIEEFKGEEYTDPEIWKDMKKQLLKEIKNA